MSTDRWERTKQLLEEALKLAPDRRQAYLDAACGSDRELRTDVESLIASHDAAGSQFLVADAPELLLTSPSKAPEALHDADLEDQGEHDGRGIRRGGIDLGACGSPRAAAGTGMDPHGDGRMNARVEELFHELAEVLPETRTLYFAEHDVDENTRREVEKLLAFDSGASTSLQRNIGIAARRALAGQGGEELVHNRKSLVESMAADDFSGTERFTVLRRLGAGGMGVVYEVHDLARGEIVALKTLRHATPAGVYRLKQEFRGLAGVAHPNVVCLYELVVEDARCFFTMELVKGVNYVEYVRGGLRTSLSIDRLTSTLRQLVDGVSALHR